MKRKDSEVGDLTTIEAHEMPKDPNRLKVDPRFMKKPSRFLENQFSLLSSLKTISEVTINVPECEQ